MNRITYGMWCIVHRKYGAVEQVWPLTPITGASQEEADSYRKKHFRATYGGETGKHTTHVELLSKHQGPWSLD